MNRSKNRAVALMSVCFVQLWSCKTTHAFALKLPTRDASRTSVSLWAKTKKPKGKKKQASSKASAGGFGKTSESKAPDFDGDYSVFPGLEKNIQETLIPWSGETSEAASGDLPREIVDRLEQIYGFPRFNYETGQQTTEDTSMSFQDLLASSEATKKSEFEDILNRPAVGDSFGDLLTVATGESSEPKAMKKSNLPLSKLEPFRDFRVLHVDPLVLAVDNFMSNELCDKYVAMSEAPSNSKGGPMQMRSKTVGKDNAAKSQRTSTTWFHRYGGVPELMAKASRLLGLDDIDCWEEPQTVRYRRTEKYTWHLDALSPEDVSGASGGQRIATLLVYLTELTTEEGGATMFRDLGNSKGPLKMRPKKGSALLFFPAAGGINHCPFDIRTLHCGEAVAADAKHDKWIAQLWLRQNPYTPTAPSGNTQDSAFEAISGYCASR